MPGSPKAMESALSLLGRGTPNLRASTHIQPEKGEKSKITNTITEVDTWVDPEAVKRGFAKRPMILTHSVMVGITLIILIAVEAILISKVSP